MRRRQFISLVGGAVVAWPRAVIAQVSLRRALVAVLSTASSTTAASWSGFSQGLQELGYLEGRDIDVVYRFAEGDQQRLFLLANELVRLKPDVIMTGSTDATLAVKLATETIPIVCTVMTDPVAFGLVESQARPGRQVTGILTTLESLPGKQLELALEVVPGATRIGMLLNSRSRAQRITEQEVRTAANALDVTLMPVDIGAANELNAGFQAFVRERVKSVLILGHALIMTERRQIADLAIAVRLPTSYSFREYPVAAVERCSRRGFPFRAAVSDCKAIVAMLHWALWKKLSGFVAAGDRTNRLIGSLSAGCAFVMTYSGVPGQGCVGRRTLSNQPHMRETGKPQGNVRFPLGHLCAPRLGEHVLAPTKVGLRTIRLLQSSDE